MIFPKLNDMDIIDGIRDRFDPLAKLVRPHITLVFPFEHDMSNEELEQILDYRLNGISPFDLEMQGFKMATPSDRFPWAGLGIFMNGENKLSISGWGENGPSRLKFNYKTGVSAAVMVNQNPGVEQSESGVEWLINNGFTIE